MTIPELIKGVPKLASYAGVLNELDAVLSDLNSTLADVCAVIDKDPALAAKLLKLGNSCYFGSAQRVETVFDAITLIGIQQVRDLIASSTVIRLFEGVASDGVDMESFWKHSLACGVAARNLAIARCLSKPERYFTAGLLHDIGRLVLFARQPEKSNAIFQLYHQKRLLLREAEQAVLGFDHAEIGAELLLEWNYPASLVDAVRYHHKPMVPGPFQMEACTIHLADHLVIGMEQGCGGESRIPPLEMKAWDRLNIALDLLPPVINSVDEQMTVIEEVFLDPAPESSEHE